MEEAIGKAIYLIGCIFAFGLSLSSWKYSNATTFKKILRVLLSPFSWLFVGYFIGAFLIKANLSLTTIVDRLSKEK